MKNRYNPLLFGTLFFFLTCALPPLFAAETEKVKILFQKGTYTQEEDLIRAGEELSPESTLNTPRLLSETGLAFTYSNRELITLSNGSSLIPKSEEIEGVKQDGYQLQGAVHLFIRKTEEEKPQSILINGVLFQTSEAHFFYNDLKGSPELTLLEGEAKVHLAGEVYDTAMPIEKESSDSSADDEIPEITPETTADASTPDTTGDQAATTGQDVTGDELATKTQDTSADTDQQTAAEEEKQEQPKVTELTLKASDQIIFKESLYEIHHEVQLKDEVYQFATIPGFERNGAYKVSGTVKFTKEELQIKRYGKVSRVKPSPATILEGDEILTTADQEANLRLASGDMIRVKGNSRFHIEEFIKKETSIKSVSLKFWGNIRAVIKKRKPKQKIRFRTATAVIGIKGTDFSAASSAGSTLVETVEGVVSVADAAGSGEVLVPAGMMTSVAAGGIPEIPTVIPPERLQELNDTGIPISEDEIVALEEVQFQSPIMGGVHGAPKLQFKTVPENATYELLVDFRKNLQIKNGSTLNNLAEGIHNITIRGVDKKAILRTVTFTIDRTAPEIVSFNAQDSALKEGESLVLEWSEPVQQAAMTINGQEVTALITGGGKKTTFSSDSIFKTETKQPEISATFSVIDPAGNQRQQQKSFKVRFRPKSSPSIMVASGATPSTTSSVETIKLKADRDIEQWNVFLDQKKLILPQPQAPEGTQPEATKPNKQELLIPSTLFEQLEEGKHILYVTGVDDFQTQGAWSYEFVVDRTAPTLAGQATLINRIGKEARPLNPENLLIKDGESLSFQWSEPLKSGTLKIENREWNFQFTEKRDQTTLSSEVVKKLLLNKLHSNFSISIADNAGNQQQIAGKIRLKPRPTTPPELTTGKIGEKIRTNKIKDITVQSNRKIYQWKVFLNDRPLQSEPAEEKQETEPKQQQQLPGKKLLISKVLFSNTPDGTHILKVTAEDEFSIVGERQLEIVLDRKRPTVRKISKHISLKKIKLQEGELLKVEWNEEIAKVNSSLDGGKFPITLGSDNKTLVIIGNPKKLTYELRQYFIQVIDLAGNKSGFSGKIALKKRRDLALRDNYRESILIESGTNVDNTILINRPSFSLDKSQPSPKIEEVRSLKTMKFKKRDQKKSSFFDNFNEPLLNNVQ